MSEDLQDKIAKLEARLKFSRKINIATAIGGTIMIILGLTIEVLQGIAVGGVIMVVIGVVFYTKNGKLQEQLDRKLGR